MLAGDSSPWRDLGHTTLYDPYALFESPISPQFKRALETEAEHFETALDPHTSKLKAEEERFDTLLIKATPTALEYAQETMLWRSHTVHIQHGYGNRLNVWIVAGDKIVRSYEDLEAFGTDPESDLFYTLTDVGNGDQTFQLSVYNLTAKTAQYTLKPVGSHAEFQGDFLYYESIENRLRSKGIVAVNKANGRGATQVYENKDKRFQVELLAPPRQHDLFIRITNALSMRIALITNLGYKWLSTAPPTDGKGETLLPVRKDVIATNGGMILGGHTYPFPRGHSLIDAVPLDATQILVSVVRAGVASLLSFDTETKHFKTLHAGKEPSDIMLHSYSTVPSVSITCYYAPNAVFEIQEGALNEVKRMPEPVRLVKHAHGVARAKDGAQIPYTFVSAVKSPKKLVVIAYGAYGLSSKRAYPKRWLPWLTQGYAIVESAPRGGRENGDAWYDAARTAERKITTFTDVAVVIKTVQERFHFKKEQTVVYGRSAGGWTAAYIGQNYSDRVGAVYAEVPYLDVIRTASNPRLPLTQLEYDEFGDPAHRPEEYEALRTISPVDSASTAPSKPAFFLVRTALHDSQVYPYEALKFAAKMRSLGWPIVVGMDRAGGHFVGKNEAARIYAEDFLLIDSALQSRGVARRKTVRRPRAQARSKLRSQTARGTKRRRASSRKH